MATTPSSYRYEQVPTTGKPHDCRENLARVPGTGGDAPGYLETVEGVLLFTVEGQILELEP